MSQSQEVSGDLLIQKSPRIPQCLDSWTRPPTVALASVGVQTDETNFRKMQQKIPMTALWPPCPQREKRMFVWLLPVGVKRNCLFSYFFFVFQVYTSDTLVVKLITVLYIEGLRKCFCVFSTVSVCVVVVSNVRPIINLLHRPLEKKETDSKTQCLTQS